MCLIVLAHKLNSEFPLILAANRDEFRHRPTQNMHWWRDIEILAGKDLEAGGTWLALHKNGRWAAVTNFRKVISNKATIEKATTDRASIDHPTALTSRGHLAVNFLNQHKSALDFANALQTDQCAGFNLLLWDNHELVFCANEEQNQPRVLAAGLYGLSNGRLDSDWPKVNHVKAILQQSLNQPPHHQQLQQMMQDTKIAQDHHLPNTGIAKAWERRLSACFIDAPEYAYGTRTCISLFRDQFGNMDVHETCFDHAPPQQQHFKWNSKKACLPA
jgi:uncharacterized protein with NRDE domain